MDIILLKAISAEVCASNPFRLRNGLLAAFFILLTALCFDSRAENSRAENMNKTINFTVTVHDSSSHAPLQYVLVALKKGSTVVATASTNPFGKAVFNDLAGGTYLLTAHFNGYYDFTDTVLVDAAHHSYGVELKERTVEFSEVVIRGGRLQNSAVSVDLRTGRQVFQGETYHSSPTSAMTQLIQQNLAGTVRAPTGEVHIRGMHGEFTYLVDGIPIPLGVFGGLNEIVDPKVISSITFYTGGFPAEYGGQLAGLMDIQNKVPTGRFHLDASSFIGSYFTSGSSNLGSRVGAFRAVNSNGQSISLSDHLGKLGYFVGASRQETDRRIDQPTEELFHNHGFDYFTFGKFDYLISENDYITMNLNYSSTHTQVPYDPTEGVQRDRQSSYNSFQTLSYFHIVSEESGRESNLFIGAFARQGGLKYTPDVNNDNKIFFDDDSANGYVVRQDRGFTTTGLKAKFDARLSHHFKYALGLNYSKTYGKEDFSFISANGPVFSNAENFDGYDAGIFAQAEWHPYEWTRLDAGARYDVHNAPSIGSRYQLSPRIKLNLFIDEFNSLSFSYDRLFMPTNIENLGSVASVFGSHAAPTVPEKDDLYEVSFLRNWRNGFSSKISGFYKEASPGLDDETLGSSTIRVNVNIAEVNITGVDMSLTYSHPVIPFSAYVNASLIHAYGRGPVSGGFLPADSSDDVFDLDHDERLSASITLNYQPERWFINLNASYASGLTNGREDYVFRTGLLDFNQGAHTTPSWILNLSCGYTIPLRGGQYIEPSLYITNLLDHAHLIKGAFFSGASFEERRNVVFRLTYHL